MVPKVFESLVVSYFKTICIGTLAFQMNILVLVRDETEKDLWVHGFRFYILFKSISVILGRWVGDNKRLSAMEGGYCLKRFSP